MLPLLTVARSRLARHRETLAFSLYTAATSARFTQAIWVIYLAAHGYSPLAIGLFEMTFHLAKLVAEVPTGIFADLSGRRASLMLACVCGMLAELVYVHPVVPFVALGFALSGTAYAFRGGAESALLWTIASRESEREAAARYSQLFRRMSLILLAGDALAGASGGALEALAQLLPFLCQSAALGLGLLPLLVLPEARPAAQTRPQPLTHLRAGLDAVRRDGALLALLLFSGLTAAIFTAVALYAQLYFRDLGLSLVAIGLVIGAAALPDALWTALAPPLIARLRPRWLLVGGVAVEAAGLLAMSAGALGPGLVGYLLLFHGADAVLTPAISRYLNERAPEAQRATVLSLDAGLFSATMIVLFPLVGLGLTHVSFAVAWRAVLLALLAGSAATAALWALSGRGRQAASTLHGRRR